MAGNYSAENSSYRMSGNYKTSEEGSLTDLFGTVIPSGDVTPSVYSTVSIYMNGDERKVNINAASLSDVAPISALVEETVAQIEAEYKTEEA